MNKYTLKELLRDEFERVPPSPGIYWYEIDKSIEKPAFKETSPAGHFKGKSPTVPVPELKEKWVPRATILYIGSGRNLRQRIKKRAKFAKGKPVSARGGRYLWQLDDSIQEKMTVRYEVTHNYKMAETDELTEFRKKFGRLPFANLKA